MAGEVPSRLQLSESSPSLLSDDVYVPGTAYVVQQDGWCEERCLDGGRDELRWLRMRSNSSSSLLSIVRYCWKHALLQAPTDGTDSANGAPARRSETRVRRASRALCVPPLAARGKVGKDFMARRAWELLRTRKEHLRFRIQLDGLPMLLALHAPALRSACTTARTTTLAHVSMMMTDPCPRLSPPIQSATSNTVTLALG